MSDLTRYRRRAQATVVAVQIDLQTDGFEYEKWGATQRAKAGDWLVKNGADTYTVDAESFARTYQQIGPGQFAKVGDVWARRATEAGAIETKEGSSTYSEGDWLVSNDPQGLDGYAMTAEKFAELYVAGDDR